MKELIRHLSGELSQRIQETEDNLNGIRIAKYRGRYKEEYRAEGRLQGLMEAEDLLKRLAVNYGTEEYLETTEREEW